MTDARIISTLFRVGVNRAKGVSDVPVGHVPGNCSLTQLTSGDLTMWSEVPRELGWHFPAAKRTCPWSNPLAENEMVVLGGTEGQSQVIYSSGQLVEPSPVAFL